MRPQPLIAVNDVEVSSQWYQRLLGCQSAHGGQELPVVPPVTASTLPADEILVRVADEPPVAQSEELVRAAKGQGTPQEELLRASDHTDREIVSRT